VWEDLGKKKLRRDLEGWGAHVEELLPQECGMPLEISVQAREILENWERYRMVSSDMGRRSLLDSLEHECWVGCEYIVEPHCIRVVSRAEADVFWREWWRSQQEKK
jgi:hypothetical protein